MSAPASSRSPTVDLGVAEEQELALRIGTAWKELRRGAAMVAVRDYFYVADSDSIDPGQMDTLDLLVQRPDWRMSELAEALRVDPSTATRAVHRLVRAGLANRHSGAEDGRVVMAAATGEGPRAPRRHQPAGAVTPWPGCWVSSSPRSAGSWPICSSASSRALDHLAADLPATHPAP